MTLQEYPYNSLWINGRFVSMSSILSLEVPARSAFEEHTFSFIRDWFSEKNNFPISTSGSTGAPKEIPVTREQMITSALQTQQALKLKKNSSCLVCIDTKYIGGRMMLVRAFTVGMSIVAVDPCASPLQKIPINLCVNFAAFVPYQVQSILGSKHPHLLDGVDNAIIGGAPLDHETISRLDAYHCCCYATYGMTETISHIALRKLNGRDKQNYFETLPGISVSADERNCLTINASYLSQTVVTNDMVELVAKDKFVWLGRWDNVINTGGVKVNPEKIETAVGQWLHENGFHPNFFVHGIEDKLLGSKIVLLIEEKSEEKFNIAEKLSELSSKLHAYEIPKVVITVPSFIMTENGKINRLQTIQTLNGSPAALPQ